MSEKKVDTPQGAVKPKAVKIKTAAQLLGVSEASIRRLIQRGLLRGNRALRHTIVPMSEIDKFLNNS